MTNIYKLVLKSGNEKIETYLLKEGENTIGRDPKSDFVIDDVEVSRNHLIATIKDNAVFIEDLDSTNGSYSNGKRLKKSIKVKNGDLITLGKNIVIEYVQEQLEADSIPEDISELEKKSQSSDNSEPSEEELTIQAPLEQEKTEIDEGVSEEKTYVGKERVNKFQEKKDHVTVSDDIPDKDAENIMGDVHKEKEIKLGLSLKNFPKWVIILISALGFLVIFCLIPLLVIEFTNQWCNLFAGFFNSISSGACP
jgi:pSer/pThr/pTyr-binding forkhead associated (FHA) protein